MYEFVIVLRVHLQPATNFPRIGKIRGESVKKKMKRRHPTTFLLLAETKYFKRRRSSRHVYPVMEEGPGEILVGQLALQHLPDRSGPGPGHV